VRTLQTVIGAATLALVAAGCGGGSPGGSVAKLGTTGSTATAARAPAASASVGPASADPRTEAVQFSQCMQTHGVPTFPDPVITTGGNSVKISIRAGGPGIDPNSSSFRSAQQACRAYAPTGPSNTGAVFSPQLQAQYLKATACMRAHGVPVPDPTFSAGGVHIDAQGIDQSSPTFLKAYQACLPLIPAQARNGP